MKIHILKGYIQKIYLIEENDQFLLLDGCCRCDVAVVKKFMEQELDRSINELKVVVVTHMHPDHAGGANLFKSKYGVKIVALHGVDSWYRGILGILKYLLDIFLTHYVAKKMKRNYKNIFYSRRLKVDHYVREGDCVPLFEGWRILQTPGHTDSDLSLFNESERVIYIADNIIKVRRKFISPYPINYPKLYKQSLNRYLGLDIESFLLAHGGIVRIEREEIEQLISRVAIDPVNHRQFLKRLTRNFKKNNYFGNN